MKTRNLMAVVATVCLIGSAVAHAGENKNARSVETEVAKSAVEAAKVTPPQRPVTVTADQLAALENLADDPKHSISPDTRAAYSPEAAKTIKSLSGPAFYAGYGGALLWVLIAAAPL